MKLLASLASPYTRKVRVVLAEKKIECDLELVDVNPVENAVNASNPLGKVPTLVLDDGTPLYDSRVIVEFLDARSPINRLIPDETRDRVAVRRWEALADGVLDAGLLVRYETLRDKKERSKAWVDKQVARMHRGMKQMAADLGERTWCHGDRYSLADIALYAYTHCAAEGGFDLSRYRAVSDWLERVAGEPGYIPLNESW